MILSRNPCTSSTLDVSGTNTHGFGWKTGRRLWQAILMSARVNMTLLSLFPTASTSLRSTSMSMRWGRWWEIHRWRAITLCHLSIRLWCKHSCGISWSIWKWRRGSKTVHYTEGLWCCMRYRIWSIHLNRHIRHKARPRWGSTVVSTWTWKCVWKRLVREGNVRVIRVVWRASRL
jgi:hypothetical protein